jgi:hypothetical protein
MKLYPYICAIGTATCFSLLVGGANPSWGQETAGSPPIPSDQHGVAPSSAQAMKSSGLGRSGQFAGTIVKQSCAGNRPLGTETQCAATDYYYALKIDGQTGSLPLLAGDPKALTQLKSPDLDGKAVWVTGTQHTTTGAILMSNLEPRHTDPGKALSDSASTSQPESQPNSGSTTSTR